MSEQPWIEKYRPKALKEIASQDSTTKILEKSLESANLPHMLFYGPAGTGKTSTILALAQQLYGPRLIRSRVLELNASDERGISIVREKIKNFAKVSVSNPSAEDLKEYPCPPFKLIILDEADSMTTDAQSALRRIMENYSSITRFCLICNYVTKIIDPLTSRCSKFRFKNLNVEFGLSRLQYIADCEKLVVQEGVLNKILEISNGDLRKAVNLLQSISTIDSKVSGSSIAQMFGYLPDEILKELVGLVSKGMNNVNELIRFVEVNVLRMGYSTSNVLLMLNDFLISDDSGLSNIEKNRVAQILFDTDMKISQGCNENVQLLSCVVNLATIF